MNYYELPDYQYIKLSEFGHGKRAGLFLEANPELIKINPREELGKIGIKVHSWLTHFSKDVIKVCVQEKFTKRYNILYLGRKSTIKWLNAIPKAINPKTGKAYKKLPITTEAYFVAQCLNDLKTLISNKSFTKLHKNTLPINSMTAKVDAFFWNNFYHWSIKSWTNIRLRFYLNVSERKIAHASQILAVSAYKQALEAPAYKEFTQKAKIDFFDQVTVTSKDNFIKPALKVTNDKSSNNSLYLNAKLPKKAKRDTSTGTTGKSTPWWRGDAEQQNVQKVMMHASRAILGDKPYTAINGFALGPWATGITGAIAFANDPNASLINIGPNSNEILDAILETVELRGRDHPIAVAGYPPYLRALVDESIKRNIKLHDYNLTAVVGGEPMSENQRDLIVHQYDASHGKTVRTGFKQCYSSYGASDLDINIGYESNFEIELRKLCFHNDALAKELFGQNQGIPMIFHYDPLNYHIEHDQDHNLVYTCVRLDRISPRVRYQLGDKGKTVPLSDILATLKKHNLSLHNEPRTNLPLLFIWGREGELISFRASKVYPANVADALKRMEANDRGLNEEILHYGIYQYEKNGKVITEFMLEVNLEDPDDIEDYDKEFLEEFLKQLQISNTDISANLAKCPDDEKPVLRVFAKNTSPMHEQQVLNPHKKKQYIFGINLKKEEAIALHQKVELGHLVTLLY